MIPKPTQFCPQCGEPIQTGQRFCTNCGATMGVDASSPTVAASQTPQRPLAPLPPEGFGEAGPTKLPSSTPSSPDAETLPSSAPMPSTPGNSIYTASNETIAPPPPPPMPTYNSYVNSAPGGPQSYVQTTPPPIYMPPPAVGNPQVPSYAQKPKKSRGCLVSSIILLIVLVAGIGGFLLLRSRNSSNTGGNTPQATGTTSGSTTGTGAGQGSTPTSNVSNTEQLNLQFTFASVNITLVSAQLANSFPDDTSTTAGPAGIARVNLQENNTTAGNPEYLEESTMLLALPDGTTAQAGNEKESISPAAGVNRQNWLDFPLNSQIGLNQLTLRVGEQSVNQMNIPLQPKADISKFQDKTSNPNTQFKYGQLNLTLKTATLSYSYADQQATAGNRYVILTLSAANNTTSSISIYPPSYMRLQAGGNSTTPDSTTTLPYSVAANASNTGVVAFLIPQNTTSFTLVMLAQPDSSPAISQVAQTFQIQ